MKDLNIFFYKSIALLIMLFIVDFLVGKASVFILTIQNDGRYYKCQYTLEKSKDEIIIIGSSRAEINYNPAAFSKVLSMSCWNAGSAGQSFIYFYAIENVILNRYSPKLIILNLDQDVFEGAPDFNRMSILRPFAKFHPDLYNILSQKDYFEKYKLHSNIYACNSIMFYLLKPFFFKNKEGKPGDNGWKPRADIVSTQIIYRDSINRISAHRNKFNPKTMLLFNEMLDLAKQKKTEIIVAIAPDYFPLADKSPSIEQIKNICTKKNIAVFDFTSDSALIRKQKYFADPQHLNCKGATVFSNMLANKINVSLKISDKK